MSDEIDDNNDFSINPDSDKIDELVENLMHSTAMSISKDLANGAIRLSELYVDKRKYFDMILLTESIVLASIISLRLRDLSETVGNGVASVWLRDLLNRIKTFVDVQMPEYSLKAVIREKKEWEK